MVNKVCTTKLKRELKAFNASPPAHVPAVHVNESNLLEWHFLLEGPGDSPFSGGFYIGKLIFPGDYPFAPPSIMVLTPNGRFQPGAKICMSMSDFHPETWNPSWSVATILVGLLSFMLEGEAAAGSIETSEEDKKQLASDSLAWNRRWPKYVSMFPQLSAQRAPSAQPQASSTAQHSQVPGADTKQKSVDNADVKHKPSCSHESGPDSVPNQLQNLALRDTK